MKKIKHKIKLWIGLFAMIAVGIASWAFYGLLNKAIGDILLKFGIVNEYIQLLIVVGIIGLVLFAIAEFNVYKTIKKIVQG